MSVFFFFGSIRIEDDPISLEYKYSLQVPDALSYHPRRTVFNNNSITVLNWSYLDNYVCARGVSDSYVLNPSLKFWRSRFMLVPIYTNETKRLSDAIKESLNSNGSRVLCDVYESDYGSLDRKKFCEKFLSFIEIVNRVRRVPTSSGKMSRQDISGVNKTKQLGSNSPSFTSSVGSAVVTQRSSNFSQAVTVSTEALPLIEESLNTTSNLVGSIVPSSDGTVGTVCPVGNTFTHVSTIVEPFLCSTNTPVHYVAFAMADPHNGLPFVSNVNTAVLPERTFLAFDATVWVINRFADVHTVDQAVGYLQILLKAGWIRHTSGNPNHAFVFGFHFYTLLIDAKPSAIDVPTTLVDGSECMIHSTPVTPLPFASVGKCLSFLP
ncbi:hypothetical protein P879_10873 [Paragonimus westermani]|uniref:DEP domain-containing protein n=1 Tax=Paragonimus westermani TaxID=34504 RepID=A0A8T0D3R4_9TREM|nr:hypothetical protein P879_10873 [Paragonimus westermani]